MLTVQKERIAIAITELCLQKFKLFTSSYKPMMQRLKKMQRFDIKPEVIKMANVTN